MRQHTRLTRIQHRRTLVGVVEVLIALVLSTNLADAFSTIAHPHPSHRQDGGERYYRDENNKQRQQPNKDNRNKGADVLHNDNNNKSIHNVAQLYIPEAKTRTQTQNNDRNGGILDQHDGVITVDKELDGATTVATATAHHNAALSNISDRSLLKQMNLITFDLDNTLFPVNVVVNDANEALMQAIKAVGGHGSSIERFNNNMQRIQEDYDLRGEPIGYSDLGRLAVEKELQLSLENAAPTNIVDEGCFPTLVSVANSLKESVYDVWLRAGAESAERNLFPDVVDCMRTIKEINPNVVVGAITNGRGSPLNMQDTIAEYFDFCVSGEDKDVFPHRKPSRVIFDAALARAMSIPNRSNRSYISLASRWVHVGDSPINDVKGSTKCGAKAVLLEPKYLDPEEESVFFSTATEEEQLRWQKEEQKARKLAIAQITSLSQLCDTLADIPI